MSNQNEQSEFTILGTSYVPENRQVISALKNQKLTFKYDKYTKGRTINLVLTGGLINAPEIEINIDHKELVGLLRFLLDEQKLTININHLINNIVVVQPNPSLGHFEAQKYLVEAIQASLKDVIDLNENP